MSSGTPTPTGAVSRRGPFRPASASKSLTNAAPPITLAEGGEYSHKGFSSTTTRRTRHRHRQHSRHPLPGAAPLYKTSCSPCRAAQLSSTPGRRPDYRQGRRFPAHASSRQASAPVRCPSRCCVQSATTVTCTPSNVVKSSQTSPVATLKPCSVAPTGVEAEHRRPAGHPAAG